MNETEWEAAVQDSYFRSVGHDEFEAKCTPEATRKIAYYMKGLSIELHHLQDNSEFSGLPHQIQFLYDFLAFTDVYVYEMEKFLRRP